MWICGSRGSNEPSDNRQNYMERVWRSFLEHHNNITKILKTAADQGETELTMGSEQKAAMTAATIEAFRALFLLQQHTTNPLKIPPQKLTTKENNNLSGTPDDIEHWYKRYMPLIQKCGVINKLTSMELKEMLLHQSSHLESNGGLGIAGIHLLIQIEKKSNPDFECYVMDISQLSDELSKIVKSCENMHSNDYRKVQFIVNNNGHFTTVDLKLTSENKQFVILDAGNEARMAATTEILLESNAFDHGMGVIAPIQSDFRSCPVFAFDHAVQASKTDLFKDDLLDEIESKYHCIKWEHLPPQFVWNAQSEKWLKNYRDDYPAEHPDVDFDEPIHGGESFNEHVKKGERAMFLNIKTGNTGYCLDTPHKLFQEYGKMMQDVLAATSGEDLLKLYKNIGVPEPKQQKTVTPTMR